MTPSVSQPRAPRRILIAYFYRSEYPARSTILDHLYCFGRYSGYECHYVNLAFRSIPPRLLGMDFDLVVLHTLLLEARGHGALFEGVLERAAPLASLGRVRVALPQDEHFLSTRLCQMLTRLRVTHVMSTAPASEWATIYDVEGLQPGQVAFSTVLPGYLGEATLQRIGGLARTAGARTIDIGYRARPGLPSLGHHGMLKSLVAERVQRAAGPLDLVTDISTDERDTFFGDAWFEFLLRCRYTIGVEGGAGILDRDGQVRARVLEHMRGHPGATPDEVARACRLERETPLALRAISPRHLEACATRTCQVLIEGAYNGVLEAGRHYIPLRADFSNLQEVLGSLGDEDRRAEIVQTAHAEIVASGRYGYRAFVEEVLALSGLQPGPQPARLQPAAFGTRALDRLSWAQVAVRDRARKLARRLGRRD